jgi:hypothetical protein
MESTSFFHLLYEEHQKYPLKIHTLIDTGILYANENHRPIKNTHLILTKPQY